jgi:flagellum-specific peptidoglycan hydrolase FlgJ
MQNYKKFMAQVEERISGMSRKSSKSDGIMARKEKAANPDQDYIDTVASYIATIRKAAQKVKAKNGS